MKKLLTTLTLFAALALTACGNKPAASGESTPDASVPAEASSNTKPSSSKHTHTYDETKWSFNETQHWHPATCEHTDSKGNAASHTWADDTSKTGKAATCEEEGLAYKICSVCGATKEEKIPVLEHDWEFVKDNAAVDGYVQTAQYKCKLGDHYALRFRANAFDKTLSTSDIEVTNSTANNPDAIRLAKAQTQTQEGSKIVYKFKSGAAVTKAKFAMNAVLKYGSGAPAPIFDYVSNDEQQGYVQTETGEWVLTTKRYQLKVNDVVIPLGQDNYGADITGVAGEPHWYDWPVEFDVKEGDNTIEILCLGGYRAYLYDFQVNGLPANA